MVGRGLVFWLDWLWLWQRLLTLLRLWSLFLFFAASRLRADISLSESSRLWQTLIWKGRYPGLDLRWRCNLIKRRFNVLDIYFHRFWLLLSSIWFLRSSIWTRVYCCWFIYATLAMSACLRTGVRAGTDEVLAHVGGIRSIFWIPFTIFAFFCTIFVSLTH